MMGRALVIVLLVSWTQLAHAEPDEATAEFERGKETYATGDYVGATAAFRRAYELDAKSDYLFAWAQAVRRGGDCPAALTLYSKLLALELSQDQRAATQQAMARCASEPPKAR